MRNLLLLLLIASGTVAHAQQMVNARTNLDSLSDEYLKVGDVHCLAIDAVKDRLIRPDTCYDIEFSHNTLTINGQVASKEMSARYLDKIRQLNKYRGLPDIDYYNFASLSGRPGISINKPVPYVPAEVSEKREEKRIYACKRLVNMLLTDKIIYSTDEVNILYNNDGIWINNRKLSVKQERKYTPLVEPVAFHEGYNRAHHNSSIRLTGYKW